MAAEATRIALPSGLALSVAIHGDVSSTHPLVLLPGPTDSWRSYRGVLERLPSSVGAIAVSQRGHGDSDKPSAGYGIGDLASDAMQLLDALAVDRAIFVGHSGSCPVARRVAIDHPDRVAGVILEASPTTLRDHDGFRAFFSDVVAELHDPIDPDFARAFIADTSTAALGPDVVDELVDDVLKVPARVWREIFAALHTYDDLPELSALTAPALLIWGDADPLIGVDMQQELLTRVPNARLVTYAGVGHTPRWEEPDRFATDLAAFVDELGGRPV